MEKICWQITVAAFMQPLQYDLRDPAAKDNSIAATARSNLDAAITMRSAETELQNTIELRATASEIVAPKPDLDARAEKKTILKHFLKGFLEGKSLAPMEKICWQITVAAFMQPLQYDLRDPAAKDNSITNAATARSNLDAAITMRSAETELQNSIELRATASEIVAPKPDGWISTPERKKDDFEALFKRIFRRKITSAKMEKICWQITVAAFMQPLQYDSRSPAAKDNSITHAAKAGSNLDAATTMRSAKTELQTAIPFTLRERSYSCKAEWNSIGNSSTSNTCNPIYIAGTILQLQITMEFHRQLIHQHHLQSHLHCGNDPTVANHNGILSTANARNTGETPFTMRNRSEHDPTMIREWSDHTRDRLAPVAPQR